jgi:hypothetical protein
MALKERIQEDMKSAMRSGEKERLATIRLILSAIKQREVDERIVLDSFDSIRTSGDSRLERGKTAIVLALLSWMRKKPCEDLNLDVTYRDARHTSIEL